MQPSEREMRLGLHPSGFKGQHAAIGCATARHGQQCRLPDPRFAAHHQGTPAVADAVDHGVKHLQLTLPADQGKHGHLAAMIIRPSVQTGIRDSTSAGKALVRRG
jgi:hypothetical protein